MNRLRMISAALPLALAACSLGKRDTFPSAAGIGTTDALRHHVASGYTEVRLHAFNDRTKVDGAYPWGGLAADATGALYGTTNGGGSGRFGTVYKLTPIASGYAYSTIYSFGSPPDGQYPQSGVSIDADGNLYGTTSLGGNAGAGTVYRLTPSASGYIETVLYNFQGGTGGGSPQAGVTLAPNGTLYGVTTYGGGSSNGGIVYDLVPSGSSYQFNVLHAFTDSTDGNFAVDNVVLDANGNLFGSTFGGGTWGYGTVFELSPKASGYSESFLYSFRGKPDGEYPNGVFLASDGTLYGTTQSGGANCEKHRTCGAVFALKPQGSGYQESIIYSFLGGSDGRFPQSALSPDAAGNLYGTTRLGGLNGECRNRITGCGTAFELTRNASGYAETVLFRFGIHGRFPFSPVLINSAGDIFGVLAINSGYHDGLVYELVP